MTTIAQTGKRGVGTTHPAVQRPLFTDSPHWLKIANAMVR
jgi:hypothetical protein